MDSNNGAILLDSDDEVIQSGFDEDNFDELGDNLDSQGNSQPAFNNGQELRIGMIFESVEEAFKFYNSYARRIGFSVHKRRTNKSQKSVIILRALFCCSCEGSYQKKNTSIKRRDDRKFGCEAMFEIKVTDNGKYGVIKFILAHNDHDLVSASSVHFMRSQRHIKPSQVGIINTMTSVGMKNKQICTYLTKEAGGPQNLNFIPTDCKNLVRKRKTEFLLKGDAQCLLNYFKRKKKVNKFFYYSIQINVDNEISGCFFCDRKSRRDYGLFSDVIGFDTTYMTNNYKMICAPFVGVNSHSQTTIFGCGLLEQETLELLVWLFNTFLEAMGGKHPKTIFTDQALAIAKAIKVSFPDAHHHLCLWYIGQNARKNLGSVNGKFSNFGHDFGACKYDNEMIEEFEAKMGCITRKIQVKKE